MEKFNNLSFKMFILQQQESCQAWTVLLLTNGICPVRSHLHGVNRHPVLLFYWIWSKRQLSFFFLFQLFSFCLVTWPLGSQFIQLIFDEMYCSVPSIAYKSKCFFMSYDNTTRLSKKTQFELNSGQKEGKYYLPLLELLYQCLTQTPTCSASLKKSYKCTDLDQVWRVMFNVVLNNKIPCS